MRTFFILLGVGTLGVAGISAAEPASPVYLLSMQMKDGSRIVGTPVLKVTAGKPARIEVGSVPGDHYLMDVTVTPQESGTLTVASAIDVESGGVHHTAKPTLQVALGKPSAIEFGEDSATAKPFRVDFTVDRAH